MNEDYLVQDQSILAIYYLVQDQSILAILCIGSNSFIKQHVEFIYTVGDVEAQITTS